MREHYKGLHTSLQELCVLEVRTQYILRVYLWYHRVCEWMDGAAPCCASCNTGAAYSILLPPHPTLWPCKTAYSRVKVFLTNTAKRKRAKKNKIRIRFERGIKRQEGRACRSLDSPRLAMSEMASKEHADKNRLCTKDIESEIQRLSSAFFFFFLLLYAVLLEQRSPR